MAAATGSVARTIDNKREGFRHEVAASTTIYAGSAIGDNGSGYARALQAGDKFLGFASEDCDNSSGSAGDKRVKNADRGIIKAAVGSLARTDINAAVYMSDDSTFTKTSSSNSRVGTVVGYIDSTYAWVEFEIAKGV